MTQRLARSSRTPGLRFPLLKSAMPDSTKTTIVRAIRAGWSEAGKQPPQLSDGEPEIGKGRHYGRER